MRIAFMCGLANKMRTARILWTFEVINDPKTETQVLVGGQPKP